MLSIINQLKINNSTNVLFLGASVTVQKEGYRPNLCELIKSHTDKDINFDVVAHGGSGSIFGLANLKQRLAKNIRYDVVFFEYLTGDYAGFTNLEETEKILIEIYESLLEVTPNVIPIYMWREGAEGNLKQKYRDLYLKLEKFYILQGIQVDKMISDSFINNHKNKYYRDDCHLTPLGGVLFADIIFSCLHNINYKFENFKKSIFSEYSNTSIYKIPFDVGKYISPYDGEIYTYSEIKNSESYEFNFAGFLHGFVVIVGPTTGNLVVDVGSQRRTLKLFDNLCFYERIGLWNCFIQSEKDITIKLSVCPEVIDYSICREKRVEFSYPRNIKIIGIQLSGSKLKIQDGKYVRL